MYRETLEAKDLFLAKAKMSDLNDIYNNYWSQEDTSKFMLWETCKNLDEAKERLKKVIEFQKDKIAYFVYDKKSGMAIGMAAMIEIEPNVFQDGGIGVGHDFVGKGYGKQILKVLMDYLINDLNAKRIICSADRNNIPSVKTQQTCGLSFTHSENAVRKKNGIEYIRDFYEWTK